MEKHKRALLVWFVFMDLQYVCMHVFWGPSPSIGYCQKNTRLSWSMISPPTHTPYDSSDLTRLQPFQPIGRGLREVLPLD